MQIKIDKKDLILLVFILILAAFFRLWKLDSIPPGLYPDEAINGNEAISSPGKIFYKENNGREGLFINLIFLSFLIFGKSILALRLVPAIFGIITVFGLYLLTKELIFTATEDEKTAIGAALLSSFFLSISFWHVNFSRIVFRAILVPFLSVFGFYFLLKKQDFEEKTTFPAKGYFGFIISGILFGLGLYTYISFRMLILLLFILFSYSWIFVWRKKENKMKKDFLKVLFCFLISFLIVSAPILFYFLKNPQDFFGRATGVSVFKTENPIKQGIKSLILHMAMFNFSGDTNWRHNISGFSILFWPVGIFFLIGFLFSIKKSMRLIKEKNYSQLSTYCFLIIWWLIMIAPGVLTYEGIPHSLRCIGAICPTFVFAGLGAYIILKFVKEKISFPIKGLNGYSIIAPLILLVFSFLLSQYFLYFELWAKNPNVEGAFSKDLVEIGNYLNSLPDEIEKYVIVNLSGVPVPYPDGIPMPAQTPIFIENSKFGKSRTTYLKTENINQIEPEKASEIILMKYDKEILEKLKSLFLWGKIKKENEIWIFEII